MILSHYQRFVAWRYLLERDRQLSTAVLIVVAACLWVGLGMGAACLWYPLADITKVPPPNPPVWLVLKLGLSFALPTVALLAAMVQWLRGRSGRSQLFLGLHWSLVCLASFGLFQKGSSEQGLSAVDTAVGMLVPFLAAVPPLLVIVLSHWFRKRSAPRGATFVALLTNPVALVLWLASGRMSRSAANLLVGVVLALELLALQAILLLAAKTGWQNHVWPLISAAGLATTLLGPLALAAFAGLVALLFRKKKSLSERLGTLSLVGILLVGVLAFFKVFFVGIHNVGVNLDFLGGWEKYTPPMDFIIPALVAGAIAILAGVLLFARYVFSFFTTVSIGGVTIGTMALVIVLSVMSGFETDLREKILGFNAHIQVSHAEEMQFTGYRHVEAILRKTEGVVGFTPFLMTEAYMSNHNNYGNVTLKGIDPARVASVTEIVHNLEPGDERALEKLWPLNKDGTVAGPPSQQPSADADFDMDDGPTDFSGGLDTIVDDEEPESEDEEEDLDLGEPVDFSGGLDEYVEDSEESEARLTEQEEEEELDDLERMAEAEDWDLELPDHDYIRPEVATLDGVLVGRELVKQISLYSDQEVRLISPLPDTSPDGLSIPRLQNFRVAGRFFSGMYEYDLKYVYCSLTALQNFLDLEDEVNGIEVRVEDPTQTGSIVRSLEAALGPNYRVQDWKELNKALFSALKLEKIAMFFILVIIVLVASFSIVGNLIMVVIEKAKEIAILKTLGSSNQGVMKIFITQGFFIGLVGTSMGIALGLGACFLGKTYGVPLDPDVYYIDKLPIQVEPLSIVLVGIAGLAISVVATIYPAFIAARMRPVKGLRWD